MAFRMNFTKDMVGDPLYRELSRLNLAIVNMQANKVRLHALVTESELDLMECYQIVCSAYRELVKRRREVLRALNSRLYYRDVVSQVELEEFDVVRPKN